jgi:light-regulated signal transduction histidine kinase (bacteriophytochrome)
MIIKGMITLLNFLSGLMFPIIKKTYFSYCNRYIFMKIISSTLKNISRDVISTIELHLRSYKDILLVKYKNVIDSCYYYVFLLHFLIQIILKYSLGIS